MAARVRDSGSESGVKVPDFTILAPREQGADLGPPFYEWVFPDGSRAAQFFRMPSGYLLRFPDLADFEVAEEGASISCFPAPGVDDATPQHLFQSQVLPVLLGNRGRYVFHGGAVEIGEAAVVFLGQSGRGKSTLVASFASSGHRLLVDDGLMLEPCEDGFQVAPGHPSVRLWSDSEKILSKSDVERAAALHFTTKTRFLAGSGLAYCDQPRPLRVAYFLGDGSAQETVFRKLTKAETLMGWAKNSFLLDVEDPAIVASHFKRIAALTDALVGYELDYPRRLDQLGRVRKAIVEHATSEGATS